MESLLRDRMSLAAVLGAGVVIGVSGLYLYFKVNRGMTKELSHLTRTIENLRKDIDELKASTAAASALAKSPALKRSSGCSAVDVSSSAAGTGTAHHGPSNHLQHSFSCDDTEEFFDVSDEGDLSQCWDKLDNVDAAASAATSNSATDSFEEIDRLLEGDAAEQFMAYEKLMGQKDDKIANPEFVWRLVRACYLRYVAASEAGDIELQKSFIFDGMKYSALGLAVDDDHPLIHKWYAVMLGRSTKFLGVQDKIKNGFLFKEHLDAAIKLRPDDSMLYFMRGRWCYEVSTLSWVERKVASTLFASPPTSSLADAKEQFLKVEELKPGEWKENLLFVAKCCIGESNYKEAIEWLDKATVLTSKSAEEEAMDREANQLLSKYSKYRV